jgi:hypothetical protein
MSSFIPADLKTQQAFSEPERLSYEKEKAHYWELSRAQNALLG